MCQRHVFGQDCEWIWQFKLLFLWLLIENCLPYDPNYTHKVWFYLNLLQTGKPLSLCQGLFPIGVLCSAWISNCISNALSLIKNLMLRNLAYCLSLLVFHWLSLKDNYLTILRTIYCSSQLECILCRCAVKCCCLIYSSCIWFILSYKALQCGILPLFYFETKPWICIYLFIYLFIVVSFC